MRKILFTFFVVLLLQQFSFAQTDSTGRLHFTKNSAYYLQSVDSIYTNRSDSIILPKGKNRLILLPINKKSWYNRAFPLEVDIKADRLNSFPQFSDTLYRPLYNFKTLPLKETVSYSSVLPAKATWKEYKKPALIVTTIAANWISFYLKREADDYYELYQQSSNPGDIKYYYDKSSTFDIYASAALSVSFTALSLYIYYLLADE